MMHYDSLYRVLKAEGTDGVSFVTVKDQAAFERSCAAYGNRDLAVSATYYRGLDLSLACCSTLYFRIVSSSLAQASRIALEVCYYVAEYFSIPETAIEVLYHGSGAPKCDENQRKRQIGFENAAAAEFTVSIAPWVFGSMSAVWMPVINYRLAHQMSDEGLGVDVDVYAQEQQFIPVANCINGQSGHYATRVSIEELMYVDADGLIELSKQPRPEESDPMEGPVPEASQWFADVLEEEQSRQKWQSHLQRVLLDGWQVPPCIGRFFWADLSEDQVLEACRIVAQFWPFIHAAQTETWRQLSRLERRYGISDPWRLSSIAAFGAENPGFTGCDHPLLRQFCAAKKCPFVDIWNDYRNPQLFA